MALPWLAKLGVQLMLRKWLARRKANALTSLKGKLTYGSLAAILLPLGSAALGYELLPESWEAVWNGGLAVLAIWGRYRASRGYA